LAAGAGTRLRPLTDTKPKCLIPVQGTPIIVNALNALSNAGCRRASIVVGHLAGVLRERLGETYDGLLLDYVMNERWSETNSMFSLHLGLEKGPADYVLEGDVFFDREFLKKPLSHDIAWLVDGTYRDSDGSYLRLNSDGLVVQQRIANDQFSLAPDWAKSVGILHMSHLGAQRLGQWLRDAVLAHKHQLYYDLVIAEHLGERIVGARDIAPGKWFEIDTANDLVRAERLFA
jgi:choline kinase